MSSPQPYPVAKRIPEDQPFVVRPSLKKRLFVVGPAWLLIAVMMLCVLGLGSTGDGGSGLAAGLGIWAVLMLVIGSVFGLLAWSMSSGGPVLAAGPAGLWIKTRPTRGQAIWLPWEAIAEISRRRWGFDKMLVARPYDERADTRLGMFTQVDSAVNKIFYGSGFTATLNMADHREAEILQAIAYFAANRVRLV